MPRCCLLIFLPGLLLVLLLTPDSSPGGELLGRLFGHHGYEPYYLGNPKPGMAAAPPGPHRYPEYNVCGPWYGYGFGVPTYNWGYFGARYRPACICHKGYYGTLSQWGYRRGY